jgi:hypothetical protein
MERGAAKLATLRCAQTDAAPFPAPRTDVTARSTGLKSNGNGNGNGHFKSNDHDHDYDHVKNNGNCRCANRNPNRACVTPGPA